MTWQAHPQQTGGWAGDGMSRRASGEPKCGNVPNMKRRKPAILGRGAKRDFPGALVVPGTSRVAEVRVVGIN